MNKDIILLYEDEKTFTITFEKEEKASVYVLLGMNAYSSYEQIVRTQDNVITLSKDLLNKFYNYKVDYFMGDDNKGADIYLGTTNIFVYNQGLYEFIMTRAIKSHDGISLGITNTKIYDKFIIYKKNNDKFEPFIESEDFVITSDSFDLESTYLIEGFKKENERYELKAKSSEFKIELLNVNKPSKKSISVVVPSYNCELFVSRCIDSLLLSTFEDKEIILINDCSTDKTIDILRWYESNYKDNITVIDSKVNEGVSRTRNKGIEAATGDYISFIDSGDYIHPLMYELLYDLASKEKLDVSIAKTIIREGIDNYSIYLNVPYKDSDTLIYTYDECHASPITLQALLHIFLHHVIE